MSRIVPAVLLAALLVSGCGPKSITVGSRPFPSKKAVFTDASGKALADLPGSKEPYRLVVLDFPWCPACGDAWKSVREAIATAPPGSIRVYRVLFDREISLSPDGKREVPPLRPAPHPWAEGPVDAGDSPVTTLTALPGVFQEEFRVNQSPVLLLFERDGTVARRWNGYSTSLAGELSAEIRKRFPAPSALPPGK